MDQADRVLIIGSDDGGQRALVRHCRAAGYERVRSVSAAEIDFFQPDCVFECLEQTRPDYVFLTPVFPVGPVVWQRRPADGLRALLAAQMNVIEAAHRAQARKLMIVADTSVYPVGCPQPMREEYIATGQPVGGEGFCSMVNLAAVAMCQAYRRQYGFSAIVVVAPGIYGPSHDLDRSHRHSIDAMIRLFREATRSGRDTVVVPEAEDHRREFLYEDDFAAGCLHLMRTYDEEAPINLGTGVDVAVAQLGQWIRDLSGFAGGIEYDGSSAGMNFQRVLDVSRLTAQGWMATVVVRDGLERTWRAVVEQSRER